MKNYNNFILEGRNKIDELLKIIDKYQDDKYGDTGAFSSRGTKVLQRILDSIFEIRYFLKGKCNKILYLPLVVKNGELIKTGYHFTTRTKFITDKFLMDIGIEQDDYYNVQIVEIKTPYDNIDVDSTYYHNINYPAVFEIKLKDDKNFKIVSGYKFKQ